MISRLFMSGTKGNGAVGGLQDIHPLAEAGEIVGRSGIRGRSVPASGFRVIEHTAAQRCGNAYHCIQLLGGNELTPLLRDVLLILRLDTQVGGDLYRITIEKQPRDLMPRLKHRPGKFQRTAGGWILGTG